MFQFIRYTQPTWPFHLIPAKANEFPSCYPLLSDSATLNVDKQFATAQAQLTDAGFSSCNQGLLMISTKENAAAVKQMPPISLADEYTFLRKYWGNVWATYALLCRLVSFKNPFKELQAFYATRNTKKASIYGSAITYPAYETFCSTLVKAQPLVAVIIPTLNRYTYLEDVLHDLEKQDYKNFEVIIVDQSSPYNESFYKQFSLNIKLLRQEERALWTARNNAVKSTRAEWLLFFDDDSRVEQDWITEHMKCVDFFKADVSAGVSLAVVGQKISDSYNYFRWATQFDSGNALVKRSVFKKAGLFNEQFNGQRMGDGEFGFRVYMHGIKSISNHKAARIHLKVSEGGLREMGSWDGFRPKKWFAPKPVPSVLYFFKMYLPRPYYTQAALLGIILSNVSYKQKGSSKMLLLSVLLSVLKSPVLYIQYLRARSIAGQMLTAGYSPEILQ
ncbi:glycosyltransferase family 2 protein [Panacibacter sp. DH6]|uniref:Glycosyltransferase family 2 protein n=1 Tax=Panacibacter microcysteis TaxID=2793269 RepID=A0A931E8M9_9BACT|nr:glycosyltransferase family A protein [Panacibacter microcysteis]MBG9377153.1 glycosyltransferase family 2 protein [Panacibacter microcysteis]